MEKNVLIIDDDKNMCEMLDFDLRRRGFRPYCYCSADEAFAQLKKQSFNVVLTDLNLPGMSGMDLCERITANIPNLPVIVITAFGSLETAVTAMRTGAYDFVTKPIDIELLVIALERAISHHYLQDQIKSLTRKVQKYSQYEGLIGNSMCMQELYKKISLIAETKASVLIVGESGTGKELIAQAIHKQGRKKENPFVAVNCAALPDTLLESELFGHTQGAFTDAKKEKKGLFVQANRGTLFLDEIGEMPITLQPKLLRALEERRVRPVGGGAELSFDARIIAATNCDLELAIDKKLFREDLFYRLNVIQIEVPPLRARGTDILHLANHFIQKFSLNIERKIHGIAHSAAEKLMSYKWPGNIRELRNVIERAVVLTQYEKITVEDLPEKIRAYRNTHFLLEGNEELFTIKEMEQRYILHVLEIVDGNRTAASQILGIDRKTLYRKIQNYQNQS